MEKGIVWKKYFKLKIEKFKNSEEYKAIQEVLQDIYPDKWEIKLEYNENFIPLFEKFNMRYKSEWTTFDNYLKNYMKNTNKFHKLINDNFHIVTTIYFPEIDIKNRSDLKHKIKDLYIKFTFPMFNPNSIIDLDGVRATISRKEFTQGYAHSHLPRNTFYEFNNFCVGSSEFGCSLQKDYINQDKGRIMQFLFLLQSYLEYESIEGVPYIKLETIHDLGDLERVNIKVSDTSNLIKEKLPIKLNKDLKIINRDEIATILSKKCSHLAIKIDGKYYSVVTGSERNRIQENNEQIILTFKNQDIKLKIDTYATESKQFRKTCHPRYSEAVIKYWESKIYEAYIRGSRTKRQNKSGNSTKSNESSKIPM